MKKLYLVPLFALIALLLSACGENGLYHLTWVSEGNHTLASSLPGDLIVLDGSVKLPSGSQLHGSLRQISGKVTVNGEILGDVTFLGGDLTLEAGSRVHGNINIGGGSFQQSPEAVVDGQVNTGTGVFLPENPAQTTASIRSRAPRALLNSILLGLLAVLLDRYFPGAVQRLGHAAVRHSMVSAAIGFLVGLVGISLLITIAYTILLIPVTLLGLFVMGAAVLLGWVAMGVMLGKLAARAAGRRISTAAAAFWGAVAFILLLELLVSLPVVGGLIGVSLAMTGLGAVFLTRFGLRHFVPEDQDHPISIQPPEVFDPPVDYENLA